MNKKPERCSIQGEKMRFYVLSDWKYREKLYINFGSQPPKIRSDVPPSFILGKHETRYHAREVIAEEGLPIDKWPWYLGAFLFLLDPWWVVVDWIFPNKKEKAAVERFNRS